MFKYDKSKRVKAHESSSGTRGTGFTGYSRSWVVHGKLVLQDAEKKTSARDSPRDLSPSLRPTRVSFVMLLYRFGVFSFLGEILVLFSSFWVKGRVFTW